MFVLAFSTPPKGLAEGLTPEEYGTRNTNVPSIQWTAKNKEREAPETAFLGPLVLSLPCSMPMGCCALVLTGRYLLARELRVRPASTK